MEIAEMQHEKNTKSSEILSFGAIRYDKSTGVIIDEANSEIHLRRQSADVLSILVEHEGELVGKDTLVDRVWGRVATTDDSLVQCIADIRRILGRGAVQTVPKKGYRLARAERIVPEPRLPESEATASTGPTRPGTWYRSPLRWVGILCMVLLGAAFLVQRFESSTATDRSNAGISLSDLNPEQSLAVLPFANLSSSPDSTYFSNGLSEDLATDLSKVDGLTVISYASTYRFQNVEKDFQQIAKQLGVRYLVRGTVRQLNQQVRINVSLIDTSDGFNMWAERYDRSIDDPFSVQAELNRKIVNALSLKLDVSSVDGTGPDPQAHYMLLRGLEPLREVSADGNEQARYYFKRALAFDQQYARAHASVAITHGHDAQITIDSAEKIAHVESGLEAAVKAIQLNPEEPHAYLALGLLNLALGEYSKAISATQHAIELDGNLADGYALYAEAALYGGNLQEALSSIQRANLLHPNHPASYKLIEGHILYQMNLFGEALQPLEKAALDNPQYQPGIILLAATYGQLGELNKATTVLTHAKENDPAFDHEVIASQIQFPDDSARQSALFSGLAKAASSL